MAVGAFSWPLVGEFLNRVDSLAALERWWADSSRQPLALIGRRRVGKSWLSRRFADSKPAVILVAEQLPAHTQLSRFADTLEPVLGVRPDLPDVPSLFRVLFRLARQRRVLAVIDEFPWLLGTSAEEAQRILSAVLAVMEDERDHSRLKLILCGSQVAQMEALFSERNPMHGRLHQLQARPLDFADARLFLSALNPVEAFERFAVTGGMPMYLDRLGVGTLRDAVCAGVLHRDAPLFSEGRRIVDQELREPRVYFAILEQMAGGARAANEIGQRASLEVNVVTKYLHSLEELRLVSRDDPFGAAAKSRSGRWRLDDNFLRFWFRFVFPYQADLESGLRPEALFDAEIAERIADHVAPVFETWCLQWLRANGIGGASRFGAWWGNAANEFRRTGERTSEEIDAVGARGNKVVMVAEAKWTAAPMTPEVLDHLERYKLPALRQAVPVTDRPEVVLFAKAGYSDALRRLAADQPHISLVNVPTALVTPGARPQG